MSHDFTTTRYLKQEYFYKTNIIRYRPGWSRAAIAKFLGEPDKKTYCRYKKGGPKRCLYLRARVAAVERSDEFRRFAIENIGRKRARSINV